MGSFNIQCNLTKFPIVYGEEVVIIPLTRAAGTYQPSEVYLKDDEEPSKVHGAHSSNCYANSYWSPWICPIFGKYDDYGRVVINLDDAANADRLKVYLNEIYDDALNTKQGENEYHDHEFKRDHLKTLIDANNLQEAWGYVEAVMWQCRLFSQWRVGSIRSGKIKELNYMTVSKLAYDNVPAFGFSLDKSIDDEYEEGKKVLIERLTFFKEEELKGKNGRSMIGFWLSDMLESAWRMHSDIGERAVIRRVVTHSDDLIFTDPEKFKELIIPFLQCARTLRFMNYAHLMAQPVAYYSQDTDTEHGYMKFLQTVYAQKVKKQQVECDHWKWIPYSAKDHAEGGTRPQCITCGLVKDAWYCPTAPEGECVYSTSLDSCDYCGDPQERK